MGAANLKARDILDELDAAVGRYEFVDLDHGYMYTADARLTVYGDGQRWAIVIEHLGCNPRGGDLSGFCNEVHFYGNCVILPPQPGWGEMKAFTICPITDGPSAALFADCELINRDAIDVRIREKIIPIRKDAAYYIQKKIHPAGVTDGDIKMLIAQARTYLHEPWASERAEQFWAFLRTGRDEPFKLRGFHFLRGLVPDYRDLLLATETERRQGIPSALKKLLQLEEWNHPVLALDQLPSHTETFRMIAEVLCTGDASRYRPTLPPNTHWLNWPLAGSL